MLLYASFILGLMKFTVVIEYASKIWNIRSKLTKIQTSIQIEYKSNILINRIIHEERET